MEMPLVRTSQRRSLTCQECAKKKVKCDKRVPCARCLRLSLPCSRELVRIKHSVVQHADEIQFLESILADLEGIPITERLRLVQFRVKRRIYLLQFGDEPSLEDEQPAGLAADRQSGKREVRDAKSMRDGPLQRISWGKLSEPVKTTSPPASSLPVALEYLAWGRVSGRCFPHRSCSCKYHQDRTPSLIPVAAPVQLGITDIQVPDIPEARKLIQFHLESLAWHHNCLHAPTFLEECQVFWQTGYPVHTLWLAVYFCILSVTLFALENSSKLPRLVGIDLGRLPSAHELFLTFVHVLQRGYFLENPHIYAVQAICISNEVANNLGLSQMSATLFGAAVRLAEYLGMHRIQEPRRGSLEVEPPQEASMLWRERVDREVGRRIWSSMMVQDYFSIYFTDSYTIVPSHVSTHMPLNADDHDLVDRPLDVPTASSYVRVLCAMAALMPDLLDGLNLAGHENVPDMPEMRDRYKHVLNMDRQLRETVRQFPPFFLRQAADSSSSVYENDFRLPWLRIARSSLAITAAEKIIMIHRPFLMLSFQIQSQSSQSTQSTQSTLSIPSAQPQPSTSQRYEFTRRTCTAAARTILREHVRLAQADDLSIWTHTPFCITAAVILCFDIHSPAGPASGPGTPRTESYRADVMATRDRLSHRKTDVLAQRGVALLNILLEQPASDDALDLIVRAMEEIDRIPVMPLGMVGNHGEGSRTRKETSQVLETQELMDFEPMGPEGTETQLGQENMDFDVWFDSMFMGTF